MGSEMCIRDRPIGAVLFIIAETIRIPKDYKQNVLQVKEETEREELI